ALLVNRFFSRLIRRSTSEMNNDPTNYKFLRHVMVALVYIVGFGIAIYQLPQLRALATSLLAGASILAVAVGFASQQALSNIISGIFIIVFKPFRVNDRLTVRNLNGIVEDITLRHTVIRDFENKRIIIPNTVISDDVIINSDFVDDKICKWVDVGISYDSDIDLAKAIMREEVEKHPLHVDPRNAQQIESGDPEVPVRVLALGESSVNLRAWAWANNSPDGFVLLCDLLESIKKRFDREGIEIPFPHRTLVYKDKAPTSAVQQREETK
ncbi:MAG: mechanosensitive ion channel family protein, partial [Bacteroidota bacterium]